MTIDNTLVAFNTSSTALYDYHGEFVEAPVLMLEPATEPHAIGYWALQIRESTTGEGTSVSHHVTLTSLRAEGQHLSTFSQDYYSHVQHRRLSMKLIPSFILQAISSATGVEILTD